jgi:hypothetical protein
LFSSWHKDSKESCPQTWGTFLGLEFNYFDMFMLGERLKEIKREKTERKGKTFIETTR